MNKKNLIGVAFTLLIGSQSAMAAQGDIGIGVKAGALGGGAEIVLGLQDLALRGGLNYLKTDFDTTIENIHYTMEPEFKNLSLLLDWHIFSGSFRLTGGLFLTDNKVNVDGSISRDLIPSQYSQYAYLTDLTDLVRLQGSVDFNPVAPYAGIGWSTNHGESGFGLSFDFGVLFQGAATVSDLSVVTDTSYNPYQNIIEPYLDEQKQEIQDELDKYEYYPVASIMLHYYF